MIYFNELFHQKLENVEKVEKLGKVLAKSEKSILRAFARTRAKKWTKMIISRLMISTLK